MKSMGIVEISRMLVARLLLLGLFSGIAVNVWATPTSGRGAFQCCVCLCENTAALCPSECKTKFTGEDEDGPVANCPPCDSRQEATATPTLSPTRAPDSTPTSSSVSSSSVDSDSDHVPQSPSPFPSQPVPTATSPSFRTPPQQPSISVTPVVSEPEETILPTLSPTNATSNGSSSSLEADDDSVAETPSPIPSRPVPTATPHSYGTPLQQPSPTPTPVIDEPEDTATPTPSPSPACFKPTDISILGVQWKVAADNAVCLPVRGAGCLPVQGGENCFKYEDLNAGAGCGGIEGRLSCEAKPFFADPNLAQNEMEPGLVEAD